MTGIRIPAWITDTNVIKSIQGGFIQLGCDDCQGRPDCRCADGHTDTTDCTCGETAHTNRGTS